MEGQEDYRGVPLPASVEAEISVLGSMLQDTNAVLRATEQLKADDFSLPEHQELYGAMLALSQARTPIDLVTMHAELSRRGTLEGVGGDAYLLRLISQVPTTANVRAYIELVREKASVTETEEAPAEAPADAE